MKEMYGNIWDLALGNLRCRSNRYPIVVTTNGFVRNNGALVMGKGIAKEAAALYPSLPFIMGEKIREKGNNNNVHMFIMVDEQSLISFPVKPRGQICTGDNVVRHMQSEFKVGDYVPGWACKAEIPLIERSLKQLASLRIEDHPIYCPRFGCGAGELDWRDVAPLCRKHLDDRFIICHK